MLENKSSINRLLEDCVDFIKCANVISDETIHHSLIPLPEGFRFLNVSD